MILVYDSTYERSFLNVREWIDTIADSTPKKVSVMIVANKIDLRDQFRAEGKRVIESAEGAKLAKVRLNMITIRRLLFPFDLGIQRFIYRNKCKRWN